jgi:hypothetical protein
MHQPLNSRVSPSVLSCALAIFGAVWFLGVWLALLRPGNVKNWPSEVPLFWLLVLCLCPPACAIIVTALLRSRRWLGRRLSVFDWCCGIVGSAPLLGACWFIAMLLIMIFSESDSIIYTMGGLALLVLGSAGYLTSMGCRWARAHYRPIGWHFGIIGSVAAGLGMLCFVFIGFLLQPGGWGKADMSHALFWVCVVSAGVAIIPAELVVWYHRSKRK